MDNSLTPCFLLTGSNDGMQGRIFFLVKIAWKQFLLALVNKCNWTRAGLSGPKRG